VILELQAFAWIMCHAQFIFFTTKITLRLRSGQAPDTKGAENLSSELRALRVLRGENIFTTNPEKPELSLVAN
jgi:hypothetical protein